MEASGKEERTRSARRAWGVVIGLLGAFGLLLFIGGVCLAIAHGLFRDDEGFYNAGERDLMSRGYAITSGELDLDEGAIGIDIGDVAAGLQFKIEGTDERPVFVGIGPLDETEKYLAGVARSEVIDFNRRDEPIYRVMPGEPPPGPPSAQPFWVASSEGTGEQRVEWDVEEGEWIAVAMNADGSRGVGIDGNAGVSLGWLIWVAIGLAVIGLIIMVPSAIALNRLWRS